ncbi:retinol-binding protein pinta-like isoform X2 [Pseudomyrmex gracilis]|nr:retinol-binding protein pinta-like isoform X2 [Pseudomyrmex gracilis]
MLTMEMPIQEQVLQSVGGNEQLLNKLSDKLRLWLKQQLHLPQEISDRRLKYFIYSAKFDFEKAKKRLDLFYTIRTLSPKLFGDYDPLDAGSIQQDSYVRWIPLPKLTPEKYRIMFFQILNHDVDAFDSYKVAQHTFRTFDLCIEENIVDNCDILIWDCSNVLLSHILKFTPNIMKDITIGLEAFGARVKAIHIFNAPSYINVFLTMMKSVMSAKLIKRICVHKSGVESLYEIIPKSLFPKDYGGDQPSTCEITEMWRANLIKKRDWFLEQNKLKTNESLRSNSVINLDDLFGVSGTFQKLDID